MRSQCLHLLAFVGRPRSYRVLQLVLEIFVQKFPGIVQDFAYSLNKYLEFKRLLRRELILHFLRKITV